MPIFTAQKSKPYGNVQRNYYQVGDRRIFFKSKMEANYALYLEFLKQKKEILEWQYEPKTFVFEKILFGTRSYKPDFGVTTLSGKTEYHETKGYLDAKSKTKLKRMAMYFPEIRIVYIGRSEYRALAKWSRLLKWY